MVLGITTMVVGVPAVIGVMEGVRMGQKNNERERHRGRKVNLVASCRTALGARFKEVLDGGLVVLRENKLYIDPPVTEELEFLRPAGHPFTGYFLPHPEHKWGWKGEGLVSTIMPDPPQLNWIYVDKDTHEIKYGNKREAQEHLVGPWDCTKLERRMLFDQWEGFMAVKEAPDVWALYFDVDDNGLRDKVKGRRIVEVELTRRERRKTHDDKEDKDFI